MKNQLHSGINIKTLEKEFNNYKKLKFPNAPEDDELYDLFSELVELDGHIAGLVSTYIKNKSINFSLLDADAEFNKILSSVKQKNSEVEEIVAYKFELDRLIKIIKFFEEQKATVG